MASPPRPPAEGSLSTMRNQARVVIIGAGIVGCSTAYHLAQMGWGDIVVVDQGPLFETGGSTSHAPGLMFQINPSRAMTELAKYSVDLYSRLTLNGEPCFYKVGGMEVAWTKRRFEDFKRRLGLGKSWGVEGELIGAREAMERVPILSDKIQGALYVPTDGIAKAVLAAEAMASEARESGANFYPHTRVTGIEVDGGRVRAVVTTGGRILTDIVVASGGYLGASHRPYGWRVRTALPDAAPVRPDRTPSGAGGRNG